MARSSARRLAAAATAAVVCVAVASVARAGEGSPPARVDLRSGNAWVGSSVGLMTLIDGDSGEVEARVDIAAASGSLVTTQYGPVGYAVKGDTGAVVRIDPRHLRAVLSGPGAGAGLRPRFGPRHRERRVRA